jgi:hypothetical protein
MDKVGLETVPAASLAGVHYCRLELSSRSPLALDLIVDERTELDLRLLSQVSSLDGNRRVRALAAFLPALSLSMHSNHLWISNSVHTGHSEPSTWF